MSNYPSSFMANTCPHPPTCALKFLFGAQHPTTLLNVSLSDITDQICTISRLAVTVQQDLHQSKTMKMTLLLSFILIFSVFQISPISSASVEQECSSEISKVTPCLDYATGKTSSPTEQCCSAVTDIKSHHPVCLCYVIQQNHDGLPSIKQLGLQEAKLLQLPKACKLANASLSECPKLLNLSANSPDAAIFTNPSSAVTSNNSAATASENSKSNGFKHGTQVAGPTVITVAMALFILVLPTGLSSQLLSAGACITYLMLIFASK